MRFVNWLLRKVHRPPSRVRPSGLAMPFELASDQSVSRFILTESKIRKSTRRPKPSAFDPSPYHELSVVHSSELSEPEIWQLGNHIRGAKPGRTSIFCRVDAPVEAFNDVKLRALRDDNPFERHTSVVDWPLGSDGNDTKALWKAICLDLSEDSRISVEFPMGEEVQ